ncbi:MAG: hypothetical protein Q9201_005826 [Fulgogasparrea decipioides]
MALDNIEQLPLPELAVPSPLPTPPPHPHDLARRLERRQEDGATCGWVNGVECYACSPQPETLTAYDYFTSGGQTFTNGYVGPSIVSVTLPVSPTTPGPAPSPTSSSSGGHGLSSGAIAGIVIGSLVVIGSLLIALGMFFFYRYKKGKNAPQPPPQPPVSSVASPAPEYSRPTVMSTNSGTPLTHAALSQAAMSDVTPNDSASQVGGPTSSVSNYHQPQEQFSYSGTDSMQTPSGLGPLPQLQQQHPNLYSGQGAQSVAGTASVMSPGSAFGSMPPVRAPGVPSPGQMSPPGQVPSPPHVPSPVPSPGPSPGHHGPPGGMQG